MMLFAGAFAFAAGANAEPADAHQRAEDSIKSGVELRKLGRESEALEKFREAYELEASPHALGQMGLAAKSLKLYVDAERYLAGALAASDDAWVRENRDTLEQARDVVAKNLGWLEVSSNVTGAELLVDGSVMGKLPLQERVRVRAGQVQIDVRAEGYREVSQSTNIQPEQFAVIHVELSPIVPPAPASTPPVSSGPSAGVRPDVSQDQRRETHAPSTRRVLVYGLGAVGVAGIAAGTYFGLRTFSLKRERDSVCNASSCSSSDGVDLDHDARTAATWSTVSFSVGVAGLAAAIVLFTTEPRETRTGGVRRVYAAPTRDGFVAGAAFRF